MTPPQPESVTKEEIKAILRKCPVVGWRATMEDNDVDRLAEHIANGINGERFAGDGQEDGLFRVFWKSGGSSLAAIGVDGAGRLWYAPTNWITVPCFNWTRVERTERIA